MNRYSGHPAIKRTFILSLVLLFWPVDVTGQSPSSDGLWRILQETDGERETLYLLLRGDRVRPVLFDQNWVEQSISDWQASADTWLLNWQKGGMSIVFRGNRRGETVQGTWELLHPQYATKNRFLAQLLFPRRDWAPLKALEEASDTAGLTDLTARLLKAAAGDESEFRAFWRNSFQPDFYPFLSGAPALREILEALKSPGFATKAERFVIEFTELSKRVNEKLEGVKPIPEVVSFPYGRSEVSTLVVQNREFLLVDPSLVVRETSGLEYRLSLAHSLFRGALQPLLPPATNRALEFYQEGVRGYLVWKLGFADTAQSLQLSTAEVDQFEKGRSSYLKGLNRPESKLPPSTLAYFGFDFVKGLVEKHGLSRALNLRSRQVQAEFADYVGFASGAE